MHPVAMVGDLRPVVGDASFQDWAQAAPLPVGRHRQLGIVEEGRREVDVRRDGLRHAGPEARRIANQDRHLERFRTAEHTSELQSLMRIQYSVFCLKKKKHTTQWT